MQNVTKKFGFSFSIFLTHLKLVGCHSLKT
jgi:hypothetical protein